MEVSADDNSETMVKKMTWKWVNIPKYLDCPKSDYSYLAILVKFGNIEKPPLRMIGITFFYPEKKLFFFSPTTPGE